MMDIKGLTKKGENNEARVHSDKIMSDLTKGPVESDTSAAANQVIPKRIDKGVIHCRPWSYKFFKHLANEIGIAKQIFVSEIRFRGNCNSPRIKGYLTNAKSLGQVVEELEELGISERELRDIVIRDRRLRSMQYKDAAYRVLQASDFYKSLVTGANILISISVDCYHTHILHLLCKSRKIPVIGLSSSFLDNHTYLTSFGEFNEVEDYDELCDEKKYLKKYVPSYMNFFKADNISTLKRYLKAIARYIISKAVIATSRIEQSRYEQSTSNSPPAFPWFCKHIKKLPEDRTAEPVLYVPIQLYPEHNTDYWLPTNLIDYQTTIINIISEIKETGYYNKIIIKDHPAVRGLRESKFIQQLNRLQDNDHDILIVDSRLKQNMIINYFENVHVLSLNSSACHEAVISRKTLITHYSSMTSHILSKHQSPEINVLTPKLINEYGLRVFEPKIKPKEYLLEMSKYHLKGYCSETHYSKNPGYNLPEFNEISNSIKSLIKTF